MEMGAAEVIRRADGEALGIEGGPPEEVGPELVFVVGPHPNTAKNPIVHPRTRKENRSGVVAVNRTAIVEIDAAESAKGLCVRAEVAESAPRVNQPGLGSVLAQIRRLRRRMAQADVARFNFEAESVQKRRHPVRGIVDPQ